MNDSTRLNWLQDQLEKMTYTGKVIFRWSEEDRGWRLHETSRFGAFDSVREAIDDAMAKERT